MVSRVVYLHSPVFVEEMSLAACSLRSILF